MKALNSNKENILLLGGNGFIGKNILDYYINTFKNVNFFFVVLSRNNIDEKNINIAYEQGNFGNKEVLINLFTKWKFSKVFHLASTTIPTSSNNNIYNDLNENLLSTITLLDVMKEFQCNYILFLSSGGSVYGEKIISPISETELCLPISSHGVVKLTIENYIKLYQKQYGINYLILRISNPFGEFHTSNQQGIINIAVRNALHGKILDVWGDGSQSKDYIYVKDLTNIIFKLIDNKIINNVINVGTGTSIKLNSILDQIKVMYPEFIINYIDYKPTDIKDFCLDIKLLNSLIDFKYTDFKVAINNTVVWEKLQKIQ